MVSFTPGSADRTRFGTRVRRSGLFRRSRPFEKTVQITLLDPLIVVSLSIQRRPTLLQRVRQSTHVFHLGTCGSLPIIDSHLCLQAFNAARLLQLVVPTSTRFAAPLLTQPDLSREKSLASRSSSRLTAHCSHRVRRAIVREFAPHRFRERIRRSNTT